MTWADRHRQRNMENTQQNQQDDWCFPPSCSYSDARMANITCETRSILKHFHSGVMVVAMRQGTICRKLKMPVTVVEMAQSALLTK